MNTTAAAARWGARGSRGGSGMRAARYELIAGRTARKGLVVTGTAAGVAGEALSRVTWALVRACARLAVAGWRQAGVTGRLIIAAGLSWPLTQVAQGIRLLAPGWPVTTLVSAALVTACLLTRAIMGAAGRWRWRRSGGRAWNRREPVTATVARNSERLDAVDRRQDDMEQRLSEILRIMAAEVAAAQGPDLRLIQGGLDEAG